MWTQFHDMYSGGERKEKFSQCFIEAPIAEAEVIFYNRFGHNPRRVTCTCCGKDYSISEEGRTLTQITGFERGCKWDGTQKRYVDSPEKGAFSWQKFMKLADYKKRDDVCIIPKADIKKAERVGEVPKEGYVWV